MSYAYQAQETHFENVIAKVNSNENVYAQSGHTLLDL